MRNPFVFVSALPPDAPKGCHRSQISQVRKVAAQRSHDSRKQELSRRNAAQKQQSRQNTNKFVRIEPRQSTVSKRLFPTPQMSRVLGVGLPHLTAAANSGHDMREAIECFIQAVVPNNAPLYSILDVSNHLAPPIIDDLIQDPSFRAIWCSSMHNCRSVLAPSTKSANGALTHKIRGMSMLRGEMKHLECSLNDYKLAAIACMAYMASWAGDTNVAEVHFSYLEEAIRLRGGLEKLGFDGWLRSTILQLDSLMVLQSGLSRFGAYRVRKDPIYPNVNDIPLPWTTDLPIGFVSLANRGILAFDTIDALLRVHDYERPEGAKTLHTTFSARWKSLRHQDFCSLFSCLNTTGISLEKLLCATLILYCVNRHCRPLMGRDIITAFVVPRAFVADHISGVTPRDEAEVECIEWMYTVLIDSFMAQPDEIIYACLERFPSWRRRFRLVLPKFFVTARMIASCGSWTKREVGHEKHCSNDAGTLKSTEQGL